MPITTPGAIATAETTAVRSGVTSDDNATINDTNFSPTNAVDCAGAKSVMVFPRFSGGTNPTAIVQPLYRCGSGWAVGTDTSALTEGKVAVLNTYGRKMYFRIHTITGSPTSVSLYCSVAEPFRFDGRSLG